MALWIRPILFLTHYTLLIKHSPFIISCYFFLNFLSWSYRKKGQVSPIGSQKWRSDFKLFFIFCKTTKIQLKHIHSSKVTKRQNILMEWPKVQLQPKHLLEIIKNLPSVDTSWDTDLTNCNLFPLLGWSWDLIFIIEQTTCSFNIHLRQWPCSELAQSPVMYACMY